MGERCSDEGGGREGGGWMRGVVMKGREGCWLEMQWWIQAVSLQTDQHSTTHLSNVMMFSGGNNTSWKLFNNGHHTVTCQMS